jgi:hypothetical protein
MANKRNIKKNISYIAGELFTECLVQSLYVPGTDKAKADEIMGNILLVQDDFLRRVSQEKNVKPSEPKAERNKKVKTFFKQLKEEFNTKSDELIEAIGKLN